MDIIWNTPRKAVGLVAIVAALIQPAPADAQARVFRCVDDQTGKITFSDKACTDGASGDARIVRGNTIDASGSREQALRRDLMQMQQRVDRLEARRETGSQFGRTQADLQAERADSRACERAKRSLDIEVNSMRSTPESVSAKRASMRSACGMREPDNIQINNASESRSDVYGSPPDVYGSPPRWITSCDNQGCWDNRGDFHQRGAGGTYFSPSAGSCQNFGTHMECN